MSKNLDLDTLVDLYVNHPFQYNVHEFIRELGKEDPDLLFQLPINQIEIDIDAVQIAALETNKLKSEFPNFSYFYAQTEDGIVLESSDNRSKLPKVPHKDNLGLLLQSMLAIEIAHERYGYVHGSLSLDSVWIRPLDDVESDVPEPLVVELKYNLDGQDISILSSKIVMIDPANTTRLEKISQPTRDLADLYLLFAPILIPEHRKFISKLDPQDLSARTKGSGISDSTKIIDAFILDAPVEIPPFKTYRTDLDMSFNDVRDAVSI